MTAVSCAPPKSDVDVFTVPHSKMKSLIERTSVQLSQTDFTDNFSMGSLLKTLSNVLRTIRSHEQIEDEFIMQVLKSRLHGFHLRKLLDHLQTTDNMEEVMLLVHSIQESIADITSKEELIGYGISVRTAVMMFYKEYLPHMIAEEKVFQPLLMEYFTYEELKQMKKQVFKSHNLKLKKDKADLLSTEDKASNSARPGLKASEPNAFDALPSEIHRQIFGYLGPRDLCRCAQVSKSWSDFSFDPSYWHVLHPSMWSSGAWTFGADSSDDCNCDCELNYDLLTFKNDIEEYTDMSDSGATWHDTVTEQLHILMGLCRYVLPRVGQGVRAIVLECSKALTNGVLYRILSQCPNLEYLDISQTIVSDLGLKGLFKGRGGLALKHLDLSGCYNITDDTLKRLATAWSRDKPLATGKRLSKRNTVTPSPISYLSVSGCHRITDQGLRALCKINSLPSIRHLDLSGCNLVSAPALRELVQRCPSLDMEQFYYCDNIVDGPYAELASGCQNLECKNRFCCRNIVPS